MKHKYKFVIDIYEVCGKKYPRMALVNETYFGIRLFGGKYNDFSSDKDYEVAITPKMIDEILKELGVDEETRKNVTNQIETKETV